jgi:hypothetical protein
VLWSLTTPRLTHCPVELSVFALSFQRLDRQSTVTAKSARQKACRSLPGDIELWDEVLPATAGFELARRTRRPGAELSTRHKSCPASLCVLACNDRQQASENAPPTLHRRDGYRRVKAPANKVPAEIRVIHRQPYKAGAWEEAVRESRQRTKTNAYYAAESTSEEEEEQDRARRDYDERRLLTRQRPESSATNMSAVSCEKENDDYVPDHIGNIDMRKVFRKKNNKMNRNESIESTTSGGGQRTYMVNL